MTRLWIHDNGSVTCKEHAGTYLKASIIANPNKREIWTPLGTWELTFDDSFPCETCVPFDSPLHPMNKVGA